MEATARRLSTIFARPGTIAYFAGGCVRDLCVGNPEGHRIATDSLPEEVQKSSHHVCVARTFGVIVVLENGFNLSRNISFRWRYKAIAGDQSGCISLPAEEDAKRRDVTINGMFTIPTWNESSFCGGPRPTSMRDCPCDRRSRATLREYRLRMLRAVRSLPCSFCD